MLCRIQIPVSVYQQLKDKQDVKAVTRYTDNKIDAYKIISELSGFDNFWFAMLVDGASEEDLDFNCVMQSSEEPVNLLIDIPETECFITDFYDFSDLIFFTMEEPDPKTVQIIIDRFKCGKSSGGLRQAIFPILRHTYVKKKLK